MSEEKYYNKIMMNDKMDIEEAKNIIDEMYQDKYKIIEENNTIHLNKIDEVKFTNLEFASVRMLREVQSLERKLEKLQKEIENLKDKYILEKVAKEEVEELLENSISKDKIRKKLKELIKNGYWGFLEERDLETTIDILKELLEEQN